MAGATGMAGVGVTGARGRRGYRGHACDSPGPQGCSGMQGATGIAGTDGAVGATGVNYCYYNADPEYNCCHVNTSHFRRCSEVPCAVRGAMYFDYNTNRLMVCTNGTSWKCVVLENC
jgi:hypothetical protein